MPTTVRSFHDTREGEALRRKGRPTSVLAIEPDVRSVARAGLRVTSAVTLSLVVLGIISLALIYGLHVA